MDVLQLIVSLFDAVKATVKAVAEFREDTPAERKKRCRAALLVSAAFCVPFLCLLSVGAVLFENARQSFGAGCFSSLGFAFLLGGATLYKKNHYGKAIIVGLLTWLTLPLYGLWVD